MEATQPLPGLDPAILPVGTRVGPWRVLGWRGRGVYGSVYLVAREGAEQAEPFALKLALHPHDERFEREAALLARIHSPHVPCLYGQGLWPHRLGAFPYLVMQWVDGMPLYEWAVLHPPTSRQVLRLLAQAARALEATHAAGGVHRDLKGDNILVRPADGQLFLTDFGAGGLRGAATLTWQVLPPGTPAYRSPEAWAFQHLFWRHPTARYVASPCDDLFALGITAYRLVTGQYPPATQPGEEGSEVWKPQGPGLRPPRELNAHVSPELETLILRLISVAPVERFKGSAREAALALEHAAEHAGPETDVPLFSDSPPDGASWVTVREESIEIAREEPAPHELERPWRAPWLALGLALAVGIAAVVLSRQPARQEVAHITQSEEETRDGGSVGLGDNVSTAPIADAAPIFTTDRIPGVGVPLPDRPFPGQRKPPCTRKGEVEIQGGCWYLLGAADPPCDQDAYDWQGACYLPSYPARRIPTSGSP